MTTASRPSRKQTRPKRRASALSGWLIGGVVAAVVAVVAVIAVVATAGDGGDKVPDGFAQTRPVTVDGDALPVFTDPGNDGAVGQRAPALSGQSFDGTPLDIAPGRPTLVLFLAHWCPHCQREVPLVTDWAEGGGVPDGIDVIAVATSTSRDRPNYPPSAWLERERFPFPVLADDQNFRAAAAYGLSSFPFFTLLDAQGTVVARGSGELDQAALTQLVAMVS